jgi:hypothetical protein
MNPTLFKYIINVILANENVRPAVYIEDGNIIEPIKKLFPKLIYSDFFGGVIVSKKKHSNLEKMSPNNFGKILGYPCYSDFENLNREIPYYGIEIRVNYDNNKNTQLFANVCKDTKNLNKFKSIAKKAEKIFQKDEYKEILKPIKINSVYVKTEIDIPVPYLIDSLMNKKKLSKIEKSKISDYLYNIGTSEIANYDFQYNNKIHKGILLELLLREHYSIISNQYLSLKFSSNERNEFRKENLEYEKALLKILDKSRIVKKSQKDI